MSKAKRIEVTHQFISVISIGIIVLVLIVSGILDNVILLERNKPEYWYCFGGAKAESRIALKETVKIKERRNYSDSILGLIQGDGYTIATNLDGSISYSGTNHSGNVLYYIVCTKDSHFLPAGEYIYSDGVNSEDPNIYTYIEGVNYLIGGERVTKRLMEMRGLPENKFFTANYNSYDMYNVVLRIEPNYSNNNITFFPMIRKADDPNDSFEPCLLIKPSNFEKTSDIDKYTLIYACKKAVKDLSESDISHFLKDSYARYSENSWFTLCFEDGTGVMFLNDHNSKALYGKIDQAGIISKESLVIENVEGFIKQIPNDKNVSISDIDIIESYLDYVSRTDYTIIMSARDEFVYNLSIQAKQLLKSIGLTTKWSDKYKYSYLALVDNGKIIEKCDYYPVELYGYLDSGVSFGIKSAGGFSNPFSSILIDGVEYSMNRRGLNIVIYDPINKRVIDTVAFDTFSNGECYRPD